MEIHQAWFPKVSACLLHYPEDTRPSTREAVVLVATVTVISTGSVIRGPVQMRER